MKKLVVIIVLGTGLCSGARGRDFWERFSVSSDPGNYGAGELSLDLNGYGANRDKGGAHTDAWGPGVGLNYFLTENIGVGADSYADAFEAPYLINFSGIYRFTTTGSLGLAPYGFAGFGRQWDHAAQWLGHIGGGAEYRLNRKTGVFVDVRYVFADKTDSYALVRFGFRFNLL